MSSFTSKLIITPMPDGSRWELVDPFVYEIGEKGSAMAITVPTGFVTDFASVPRVFWRLIPPWGVYGKAAVLHDWLYFNLGVVPWSDRTDWKFTRRRCDSIFLEAMTVLGVPPWKRWVIHRGVRLGGWAAWRAHKKRRSAERRGEV